MSNTPHSSPFDAICHVDDEFGEYKKACEENGRGVSDHFVQSYKAITGGKGAKFATIPVRRAREYK